ncbi:MAG: hypothetical protein ACJ71L_01685 [Nitrososphaeraceae archaeon]
MSLINSKLLNISLDDAKTENYFIGLPIFGLTTSLTDENNKSPIEYRILTYPSFFFLLNKGTTQGI